jgi:hypothetical protein
MLGIGKEGERSPFFPLLSTRQVNTAHDYSSNDLGVLCLLFFRHPVLSSRFIEKERVICLY